MEIITHSAAETELLGERLGGLLSGGELICLVGELGAGKTVFVRGLARALGCPPGEVTSPTYVLERMHPGERLALRHLDAYRLSGAAEFEEADLAGSLAAPGTVAVLEWADRVESALPAEQLVVRIGTAGETCRRLVFTAHGERYRQLLRQVSTGYSATS